MDPLSLRETVPALETGVYCNWGAGGPSPRRVVEATEDTLEYHEYEAPTNEGMYAAAFDGYEDARERIADLLGATASEIALTESTADGINRVAGAFDWDDTDVLVRTDLEHAAGILPWQRLEREYGVDVRVLETEDGRLDLEDVKTAATDATLCCISSLTWTHGTRLPIADIVDIVNDAGGHVLVDAVQAPGHVPIDVKTWGADFVVAAGHKWLCGPFGSGFLYVRDGAERDRTPAAIGYRSVAEPDADRYSYATGAKRFEIGSASPAPHAGLVAAIDLVEEIGIDRICGRIETLTDRLKDGIADERLLSPRAFESGLVTIDVDDPDATVDRLAADGIAVRDLPSPDAIRVSVHALNTERDIDAVLEAL
ncbi:aminotransferase class V-fold PLP-dependent enzyme [Salinadaptatus halalkaliphilus]|uniref:Aminotransferase class V-fold PLP-dependent enzyme n=1 Tax=Salinadaptatus halalkaliphilus TaxID=2419781 RepID=A0A4S3TK52_9EURY|nr:aminotransferase class V-fold PLP-dependent enzyme [Salinadaptatus halalkaliphilus]THE63295.1 aminotransferase class V-fold PLP-dependent enzyme [Salinadaptatus halalkaliphilus]